MPFKNHSGPAQTGRIQAEPAREAREYTDLNHAEPAPEQDVRPGASKGKGRVLVFLLCTLLAAAGIWLMYTDMQRDCRHGVIRCRDGRMMAEPAAPEQEIVEGISAGVRELDKVHPEITQYMMLVPTAAAVQSSYLPDGIRLRDQAADLSAVRQAMPQTLTWIDLVGLFRSHAGEKLYYATDVYLTGWGSRYASGAVLDAMEAQFPEGKEACYLLSASFLGSLAKDRTLLQRYVQKKTERLEIYVPEEELPYYREDKASGRWYGSLYDAEAAQSTEPYDVFFGGERPLTEIHTAAVNGETLLVIGDRTADSIVPRFVSSFENIILMHPSKCAKTVGDLVEKYKPTRILYLYGANTFLTDSSLLRALSRK